MSGWSAEEVALLRELRGNVSSAGIARRLGRSRNAVAGKARRLDLAEVPKATQLALLKIGVRRQRTARPALLPEHKPALPVPPPRVAPSDPAARIAEALLASARAAESRCVAYRTGRAL